MASLVCPIAPFLAPRLLRAAVHSPAAAVAAAAAPARHTRCSATPLSAGFQRATYATTKPKRSNKHKGKSSGRQNGSERRVGPVPEQVQLLQQFRNACDARTVAPLMELYPAVLPLLERNDTRRLAQALHALVRNISQSALQLEHVLPFLERVTTDIRQGALPPHPYAHVHLLGAYKDCKKYEQGQTFWQWLVHQDETFISQAVYGAAIELLAYGGLESLEQLEQLYLDGLKRFPGTFAEYHLSPGAIVPDRSQPTAIVGVPMLLLQGIMTARILSRDWKGAYLAFDTALRLYPSQTPTRFFELLMTERPLPEAYTTYLVACRSGVIFRPAHVTALITKLRGAMASSPSLPHRMILLRAIANAIYAYMEAGGKLESIHVGLILRAFDSLLPGRAPGQDYQGEAAELRNAIVLTAHEALSTLLKAGMAPQIHCFVAMIVLAGTLRVPNLLAVILQDAKTAMVDLGPIGNRSVLTSAGQLGDKELVEEFWRRIAYAAENRRQQISYEDWITFARACRRAEHADFFKQQVAAYQHAITATIERIVLTELARQEPDPKEQHFGYMTLEDFGTEMEIFKNQIKNIAAVVMSGQALHLPSSPFYMFLNPDRKPLSSEANLRIVYEELTTDPHQPPPPPPPEGSRLPLSPTGIRLDELRFQNWVSVLELMDDAAVHEIEFQSRVDSAIQSGKPVRQGEYPLNLDRKTSSVVYDTTEDLRVHVKALRAPGTTEIPNLKTRYPAADTQPFQPTNPTLRYYMSLESYHEAPNVLEKLSRRPLGKPKKTLLR